LWKFVKHGATHNEKLNVGIIGYDILIRGGGPSGLSTALYLHKLTPHLAPRILLLEKAQSFFVSFAVK
jgi:ribulose 1,5-bisphosphate synthetase/thiazole synthase